MLVSAMNDKEHRDSTGPQDTDLGKSLVYFFLVDLVV